MRRQLRDLTPAWRTEASVEICRHLSSGAALPSTGGVGSFSALPTEPDVDRWHAEIARRGWWVAFPRLADGGGLEFRIVEGKTDWVDGPHGLRQPDPSRCRLVSPDEIGLVLIPGLAFTADGARLGRGGGYYDRWLAGLPSSAATIGVAFSGQVVDSLPIDAHDRFVDRVVTDSGWLGGFPNPEP